jgi:hypothetical protein
MTVKKPAPPVAPEIKQKYRARTLKGAKTKTAKRIRKERFIQKIKSSRIKGAYIKKESLTETRLKRKFQEFKTVKHTDVNIRSLKPDYRTNDDAIAGNVRETPHAKISVYVHVYITGTKYFIIDGVSVGTLVTKDAHFNRNLNKSVFNDELNILMTREINRTQQIINKENIYYPSGHILISSNNTGESLKTFEFNDETNPF